MKQNEEDIGMCSDGVSLSREQVEKMFLLVLVIDDPKKWLAIWFKYDWRKRYESFLLEKQESESLPRFDEFLNDQGEEMIEKWQRFMGISDSEKEAVAFRFNNPDQPLPKHLTGKLIEEFPTPGKARKCINNKSVKPALERWYVEYKHLCDYTHIGPEKLLLSQVSSRQVSISKAEIKIILEKETAKAAIISFLAALHACSEVYQFISPNVGVIGELTKLWDQIANGTLIGKIFWDIRVKEIFPPLF